MPNQSFSSEFKPGYGVKYDIWQGRYYGGDGYFHHKTNMSANSWNMAMVEAVGYSYGGNAAIRSQWCWHVSTNCGYLYNVGVTNFYSGMNAERAYISGDCYVVFVAYTPSYYSGWTINAYTLNPTGDFDLGIIAVAQTNSSSNYY